MYHLPKHSKCAGGRSKEELRQSNIKNKQQIEEKKKRKEWSNKVILLLDQSLCPGGPHRGITHTPTWMQTGALTYRQLPSSILVVVSDLGVTNSIQISTWSCVSVRYLRPCEKQKHINTCSLFFLGNQS